MDEMTMGRLCGAFAIFRKDTARYRMSLLYRPLIVPRVGRVTEFLTRISA